MTPPFRSLCPHCLRTARGPACSGCLEFQSLRAADGATLAGRSAGGEGVSTPLPAAFLSQLCRGLTRPRYVAGRMRTAQGRLGRFLQLAGGASCSAGLFGGPVVSTIRLFLSSFVAERKGAWNCCTKVALKLVNSCTPEPVCPRP